MEQRLKNRPQPERNLSSEYRMREYGRYLPELLPGETIREFSHKKPMVAVGISCIAGAWVMVATSVFRGGGYPLVSFIGLLLAVLFAFGAWRVLYMAKKEYVAVTDRRVLVHKFTLKHRQVLLAQEVPIGHIKSAQLYKPTTMFLSGGTSGDILIKMKDGSTVLLPTLGQAQYVLEALTLEVTRHPI